MNFAESFNKSCLGVIVYMEVSQGSDFSGPFDVRSNPNYLKNPACRQQNRGARGARRNSNFLMYIGYVS